MRHADIGSYWDIWKGGNGLLNLTLYDVLFHLVPAIDFHKNIIFKHEEAQMGTGYKCILGHFVVDLSDLRPFLMDTQLRTRGLDVSLSPSGGEMDQIEGEAVWQAWYTQNMCWGLAGNSCRQLWKYFTP